MGQFINEMYFDTNNGVCLKKNYKFYTYNSIINETGYTDINLQTGEYVVILKNINENYILDIEDQQLCLIIPTGTTITDWVTEYVNAYTTTGYTEQHDKEDRILLSQEDSTYYSILHTGTTYCTGDTTELWGIIDINTNDLWNGTYDYKYEVTDQCDNNTGVYAVKTKNINKISSTAFQIKNYILNQ